MGALCCVAVVRTPVPACTNLDLKYPSEPQGTGDASLADPASGGDLSVGFDTGGSIQVRGRPTTVRLLQA